jgi:hypothetical protein
VALPYRHTPFVRLLDVAQENRVLREQLRTRPRFAGLIGVSPKMQRVYRLLEKVSQHNYPFLFWEKAEPEKSLWRVRFIFRGSGGTGRSCRSIARRWCPR